MRLLKRNLQTVYYSLYEEVEEIQDDEGYYTGEKSVSRSTPVAIEVSLSPAAGDTTTALFGNLEQYDKVMTTDDLTCPITKDTVLWVETSPDNSYDYIVRRVSKSLNYISYAIAKVDVS